MNVKNRVPELVAAKYGGDEKINIYEVSKAVDLSYPTTHEWIRGTIRRVDMKILAKWCKYLGVSTGEILVYEEEGN